MIPCRRHNSAVGNLTSKTDRKGQTIEYVHDALDRLSHKGYPDSTGVNYVYDLAGKVLHFFCSSKFRKRAFPFAEVTGRLFDEDTRTASASLLPAAISISLDKISH